MWPLLVAFAWGLYPFFLKFIPHAHPYAIWTLMSIIGTVIGLVICLIMKQSLAMKHKKDYLYIAIPAVIGALGSLLYICLLMKTDKKSIVIAMAFTAPLFACLLGHYFFDESLTLKQFIGIAVIVTGILLIVF